MPTENREYPIQRRKNEGRLDPETETLFLLYVEHHGEDLPHIETNYAVHLANEFLGSSYPQYQV